MKEIRPYVLAETNWKEVKSQKYKVAILPWGATEAHNYHLPYATDNFQAEYLAIASAGYAWERGAKCVVFPTVPFGVNTGQLDVSLCLNMNPTTQLKVLEDLVDVLDRQGVEKLVIFNGHGGNDFKWMIRELSVKFPKVFVCTMEWWRSVDFAQYFDEPGDHAGELETSAMMHIRPDLVLPLGDAGDGATRNFKVKGLREGWVKSQRQWTSVSKDTGVGNPEKASAEKGKELLEAVTKSVGEFLVELSSIANSEIYES